MGVPIQIITPVNHKFELQLENLKPILEADAVKDRNVVIVSVAGAFRKGKSFLLNFFLRYLDAQYKKHNVTDWISESTNGAGMAGFEFAGGRKPKTTGIWMWSEIFTHDYENGEKVAIILLDTQGIHDTKTTVMDNTTIFAISMMLSSVQCYNVMQNIQEDDLQHLELFTEYGRLALNQTNEKAFQKLLFIVRDWPNAFEIPYGNGQAFVNELLAERSEQTEQMIELRKQIKTCFEQINAYLMPHPGTAVATGRYTNDDLSQIDPEFVNHLKILVPSIFAPKNLIPKKISGEKIRVRDLVTYLQTFVNIFNSDTTPNPNSVVVGTALAAIIAAVIECFDLYADAMQKSIEERSLNANEPYFDQPELEAVHDDAKAKAITQFQEKRLLGGDEFIQFFRNKLSNDIATKYKSFKQANVEKENGFKALAKANMQLLYMDCLKLYTDAMKNALPNDESFLSQSKLQETHETAKRAALSKFGAQQVQSDQDQIQVLRNKLENEIQTNYTDFEQKNGVKRQFVEDLKNKTEEAKAESIAEAKAKEMERILAETTADKKNLELYNNCLNGYTLSMQQTIIRNDSFYSKSELDGMHENTKRIWLMKFNTEKDNAGRDKFLKDRLGNAFDMSFVNFSHENDAKRRDFQEKDELLDTNKKLLEQLKEMQSAKKESGSGNFFSGFMNVIGSVATALLSPFL